MIPLLANTLLWQYYDAINGIAIVLSYGNIMMPSMVYTPMAMLWCHQWYTLLWHYYDAINGIAIVLS